MAEEQGVTPRARRAKRYTYKTQIVNQVLPLSAFRVGGPAPSGLERLELGEVVRGVREGRVREAADRIR